jgi:hypothetical protein
MIGPLLAALERVSSRVRRFVVAVAALFVLGVVTAGLTPNSGDRRRPTPRHPAATSSPRTSVRRLPPPVSTAHLALARRVGERFLAGFPRFSYGRDSALATHGLTPPLRHELLRQRAQLTPVERRRRPRVVSLQTVGTTPTFVVATAEIEDGGVARYRLRFTLQGGAGRWAVGSVEEG